MMKNVYVHACKKDEHSNKFDVHVWFRTLLRVNSIQKPSTTRSFTSFSKTKIFRMVDRKFRIIIDESSGRWLVEFFSASIWIFQIWIRERMSRWKNQRIREWKTMKNSENKYQMTRFYNCLSFRKLKGDVSRAKKKKIWKYRETETIT